MIHSFRSLSLGQQGFLLILACFILTLLYFRFYHHPFSLPPEEKVREVVVEVSGEVKNPGLYLFPSPPSVKEAIEKAGGLKKAGLFDRSASSETLATGALLTVVEESPEEIKVRLGRMEAKKLLVFSIPLDLDRASVEDLCLIPGIGESLAQEIVSYRAKRRGFQSVEELKNVKGIGEKKYLSFKPFFTTKSQVLPEQKRLLRTETMP